MRSSSWLPGLEGCAKQTLCIFALNIRFRPLSGSKRPFQRFRPKVR